jgi:glutamate/tyrosine decarboxylase-like PLP-dependent enzyme
MLSDNFLQPDRANGEHLRQMGYDMVDLLMDGVVNRRDQPLVKDNSGYGLAIPAQGRSWQDLLREIHSQILPRCLNLHNPRYMAHMDSVPLLTTVWADALISALNNNQLSHELSPLFTQMELDLVHWFGGLFGLGANRSGLLMAGGTLANILAMRLALGSFGGGSALVSESAHTSFDKAMAVLGLGKERLVRVPCNDRGEMLVEELADICDRQKPFFIGAIAGSTVTGAFDNFEAVAKIAKKYQCWFHIDAAYGGSAILSPQWKHLLAGSGLADSITFNPQKWMWVARTCAMLMVNDRATLAQGLATPLPYMNEMGANNLGSYGLQGTRRSDVLKLWIALQSLGTEGYAQLINRSMANGFALAEWVRHHPLLTLACEPTVNIVCMRGRAAGADLSAYREMLAGGAGLGLSMPHWKGDQVLRAVVLHPYAQWQ